MRKKIVVWGRHCHIRTQSDLFLLEILKEIGDVEVMRHAEVRGNHHLDEVKKLSPDLVVFFQQRPDWRHHALRLWGPRKVWVPMWDTFRPLKWYYRWPYRLGGVDSVSFSQPVHDHLEECGLKSLRVRYFPEPRVSPTKLKDQPPYTLFLWQRHPEFGLEFIANLFPRHTISKVFFKRDVPAYPTGPLPFEVEHLEGWMPKEALCQKILQADYYLAPRPREGIGFSYLEAMALGRIVIAHNDATMNEYIQDGVTGHLFDKRGRLSERWPSPAEMQANLVDYCGKAHATWLKDRKLLKAYLEN